MTQSVGKLAFEEYVHLNAEDSAERGLPEGRHEYADGELIEVPSESELNDFIANLLMFLFASSGAVPLRLIRPHSCEIEVPGKPLLNPETETIEILALQDDRYIQFSKLQGATFIESPTFARLNFTAAQIFSAGSNG
jgi:Uma2 family endonuclease